MVDVVEIARSIEKDLIQRRVIVKQTYRDLDKNQDYYLISTPDVFKKDYIFIIVSGHPEIAGVWSNTLLSEGRIEESSMESYFKAFHKENWGLVALNPHYIEDDLVGTNYLKQLGKIIEISAPESSFGFIGFSMGGRIIYDFLNNNKSLVKKVIAIAQIDPVIQSFNWDKNTINSLENRTILFASSTDKYRFGDIASRLLKISSVPVEGIHGALPSRCLERIVNFFMTQVSKL
jgi:hypothetical protein